MASRKRWGMAAAAALATWAGAGPAFGYVRTVTASGKVAYWPRPCVQMVFSLGDPPPALTADEYLLAAQQAAAAWSASSIACTAASLTISASSEKAGDVAADDVRRIIFRRDRWCRQPVPSDPTEDTCYPASALAITSVFTSKQTGAIVDTDLEINAVHYSWGDLVAQPGKVQMSPPTVDLQNTLTHEFGHVFGFDHSCWDGVGTQGVDNAGMPIPRCGDSSVPAGTMAPVITKQNDVSLRTLGASDVQGVCEVYPSNAGVVCANGSDADASIPLGPGDTSGGGGCAYAARQPSRPALPFLFLGAGLLVAIARLSSKLRAPWLISTFSRCRTFGAFIRRTKRS